MIRKLFVMCVLLHFILLGSLSAQQRKSVMKGTYLTMTDLAGIWQRGSEVVGNGLGQNFQFSSDGQFVLNVGDERDDLRVILQIRGKYRLLKDQIYFTILSKKVLDGGEIWVGDTLDGNVFSIQNAQTKDVKIANPKEIQDGCIIGVFNPNHIRIINVDYYKVDLKKYKIDQDEITKW